MQAGPPPFARPTLYSRTLPPQHSQTRPSAPVWTGRGPHRARAGPPRRRARRPRVGAARWPLAASLDHRDHAIAVNRRPSLALSLSLSLPRSLPPSLPPSLPRSLAPSLPPHPPFLRETLARGLPPTRVRQTIYGLTDHIKPYGGMRNIRPCRVSAAPPFPPRRPVLAVLPVGHFIPAPKKRSQAPLHPALLPALNTPAARQQVSPPVPSSRAQSLRSPAGSCPAEASSQTREAATITLKATAQWVRESVALVRFSRRRQHRPMPPMAQGHRPWYLQASQADSQADAQEAALSGGQGRSSP